MSTQHYLSLLVKKIGALRCTSMVLQLWSVPKWFSIQVSIIRDENFITSCWQEKVRCWWMDELIHHPWQYLLTCSQVVHKKCHPIRYHSDTKCHMTLIIFNVAAGSPRTLECEFLPSNVYSCRKKLPSQPASSLRVTTGKSLVWSYRLAQFQPNTVTDTMGHFTHKPKSRDHAIVTAQKKVSQGNRPNTPPTSCSAVTGPQMQCEVICP